VGFHSLTTTTHPPNVNLPSSGQQETARLSARKVSVVGREEGEQGPRSPGQGHYSCSRVQLDACRKLDKVTGGNINGQVSGLTSLLVGFFTLEVGTDRLCRNIGKQLPHYSLRNDPEERSTHFKTYHRQDGEWRWGGGFFSWI